MKKSALRKILDLGLLFTVGDGWKLHPLGTNCVAVEKADGSVILTDGDEQVPCEDLSEAMRTTAYKRFLLPRF